MALPPLVSTQTPSALGQPLALSAKVALIGLEMNAFTSMTAAAVLTPSKTAPGQFDLRFTQNQQKFSLSAQEAKNLAQQLPQEGESLPLELKLTTDASQTPQAQLAKLLTTSLNASSTPGQIQTPGAQSAAVKPSNTGQAIAQSAAAMQDLPDGAAPSSMAQLARSAPSMPTANAAPLMELAKSLSTLLASQGIGFERAFAKLISNTPADQALAPREALVRFAQVSDPGSLHASAESDAQTQHNAAEGARAGLSTAQEAKASPSQTAFAALVTDKQGASDPSSLLNARTSTLPADTSSPAATYLAASANAQQSQSAAWQGVLWPGAPATAELGFSKDPKALFKEQHPTEDSEWLDQVPKNNTSSWLRLQLDLPGLGALELWAAHIQGQTFARLKPSDPSSAQKLRSLYPLFETALQQAQVSLSISNEDANKTFLNAPEQAPTLAHPQPPTRATLQALREYQS